MTVLNFIDIIHFNVNGFKLGIYSLQMALVMLKHFGVKRLLYYIFSGHLVCI